MLRTRGSSRLAATNCRNFLGVSFLISPSAPITWAQVSPHLAGSPKGIRRNCMSVASEGCASASNASNASSTGANNAFENKPGDMLHAFRITMHQS
jgi:hypothetical protein